jgi:hypothetical protein
MAKIKGITIKLYAKTLADTDPFGAPVYIETPIDVGNVLVTQTSSTEVLDIVNLYGKKAVYTLGIPKDDTNDWEDKRVSFFGEDWHTFGIPQEGIEANIPLEWNKKVLVERYE